MPTSRPGLSRPGWDVRFEVTMRSNSPKKSYVSPSKKSQTPKPGSRRNLFLGVIALLVLVVGLVVVLRGPGRRWLGWSSTVPLPPPAALSKVVREGDEASLGAPGAKEVFLVLVEEDWNTFQDAEDARDRKAMDHLKDQGKVISVQAGTLVKALKQRYQATKVRIRDGQNARVEAWVRSEYLHPVR